MTDALTITHLTLYSRIRIFSALNSIYFLTCCSVLQVTGVGAILQDLDVDVVDLTLIFTFVDLNLDTQMIYQHVNKNICILYIINI